jgi:2-octaprenyl-3-methyl-6-methoxy-1,4-benzoquinol hydroxylase
LSDTKACLIDYDERASIRALQHDESALQKHLCSVFEPRVGKFRVIKAASFPLQRKHALNYTFNGCIALLGDSAHSIHPMAGQGVNLGFADIQCLVSELSTQPVSLAVSAYEKQRKFENAKMMRLMDALQISWRSTHPLARFIADVSLTAAKAPLLKNFLIKQAIGD